MLLFVCVVLLLPYIAKAQNRPRNPTRRMQPKRTPPNRVLNKVQPARQTRPRAQQQAMRTRVQNNQNGHKRIKPAVVRGYFDVQWCDDDPFGIFPDDLYCDGYWYCDNGEIFEGICPEETPVFDMDYLECYEDDGTSWCLPWSNGEEIWEGECPADLNELAFLPGDTCDDYFICINGFPRQWWCAPGQHWDEGMQHCDSPISAGCDVRKNS